MMDGMGAKIDSTLTDNKGTYEFIDLPLGDYLVNIFKNDQYRNVIGSYDASLDLQYIIGAIELTPYQMIAADISGDGNITPYDVSLILRYCANSINEFPINVIKFSKKVRKAFVDLKRN